MNGCNTSGWKSMNGCNTSANETYDKFLNGFLPKIWASHCAMSIDVLLTESSQLREVNDCQEMHLFRRYLSQSEVDTNS